MKHNVVEDLLPYLTPVEDLTPDPANVRLHPERNLRAIAASLRRFGQRKPIVVNANGTIEAGNGTLEAARDLGWTHVAAVRVEDDSATAVAYAIADNRTAELAHWNYADLGRQLDALKSDIPIDDLGFTTDELDALLDGLDTGEDGDGGEDGDDQEEEHDVDIRIEGVKPCDKDDVLEAINAALEGHDHLTAEAY